LSVYQRKIPFVSKLFQNRIKTALKLACLNDESILLDVGYSSGYLLTTLRNHNCLSEYYGIDIHHINPQINLKNSNFGIGDVRNLPYHDSYFDVVFLLDVLEHIGKVDIAIKEVFRVLKPEGLVILSGPTESWFYKFCRVLWLGKVNFSEHKNTIYEIEEKFESNDFTLVAREFLPSQPLPPLFRISKFKKTMVCN